MPLRFLNAGESHGPELTVVIDGLPARLPVDLAAVRLELARRQRAFGAGGRMRIEEDDVVVTAGAWRGAPPAAPSPCASRTATPRAGASGTSSP
jgi:chorismate synthase